MHIPTSQQIYHKMEIAYTEPFRNLITYQNQSRGSYQALEEVDGRSQVYCSSQTEECL